MANDTVIEGIHDAIFAAEGKLVTLYLASGLELHGTLEDITYLGNVDKSKQLTKDEKRNLRPRMVTLSTMKFKTHIDAIKIDAVRIAVNELKAEP